MHHEIDSATIMLHWPNSKRNLGCAIYSCHPGRQYCQKYFSRTDQRIIFVVSQYFYSDVPWFITARLICLEYLQNMSDFTQSMSHPSETDNWNERGSSKRWLAVETRLHSFFLVIGQEAPTSPGTVERWRCCLPVSSASASQSRSWQIKDSDTKLLA